MGARFGPRAILSCLQKMALSEKELTWEAHSVSEASLEKNNFKQAQNQSAQTITSHLKKSTPKYRIQLGGGHDHIYPLLKAIEASGIQKILVINLDAHCDTRQDSLSHSGTPFRQFAKETKTDFTLIQMGILPYANTTQTISPLENGKMVTLEPHTPPESILKENPPSQDTHIIISLDCDVLPASIMEGVSAVNHEGVEMTQIQKIFRWSRSYLPQTTYGIYEYNPVYDNLSEKGARALSALIYRTFFTSS